MLRSTVFCKLVTSVTKVNNFKKIPHEKNIHVDFATSNSSKYQTLGSSRYEESLKIIFCLLSHI